MRISYLALAATAVAGAVCNGADKDGKYWLNSSSIQAAFIPYGASLTNLILKDKYGVPRDVTAGFDNATFYSEDTSHPHFGGVPGRYANRIKNSSFELDGKTYHILPNENNGADTLHGGPDGWDWRNFTVESYSKSSITFKIVDPDGDQGFPGEVIAWITYSVNGNAVDMKMTAVATTKPSPIMLAQHGYWNLDGFSNNQTGLVLNHTFYLPYSGQRVGVDNILIPTGDILANQPGSVNDFWSKPKQLGTDFGKPELDGNCGFNCTGYDNCWLVNREQYGAYDWRNKNGYVARLQSAWSGIQLDIYSEQEAFQLYTCNFQDGTMPLKRTQGINNNPKFPRTIPKYGCVVLEVEDWIDAINQPEWQRTEPKQTIRPGGKPYVLEASYVFSVNHTAV